MREPDFKSLQARMLQSGIAPRHARGTVNELQDHFQDLADEALAAGASLQEARTEAADRLGELDEILAQMRSRSELRGWAFRYPRTALVLYPLGCLAMLPALPIIAGMRHAPEIARWGTSFLVAGLFTATMLLAMQLSILLG